MPDTVEILIADDHELFRRTLRSFIEAQTNWHVCGEAGDGAEAVDKAKVFHPDVVLMDINMPRMDGLEATRILRRDLPDCRVVIVTQNHASIARQQAASVDAYAAITKSELMRDLRTTVESMLGGQIDEPKSDSEEEEGWVAGGGALGRLVKEFDWGKTPLGPIWSWPQSLKVAVRILLTSRFAMWMCWGKELTFLYNDAYAKMTLGKKHPWALGQPSWEVWKEIWDDIGPRIEKVLATGQATWDEGLLLFLERSGYREETYHTFSYSPLSGDNGRVAGMLCVVTEETDRVIGERRLNTLRSLSAELSQSTTEAEAIHCIGRVLAENQQDMPFTLTYLFKKHYAQLACRTGISESDPAAPETIDLDEEETAWPLTEILDKKDFHLVEGLQKRFASVPCGRWQEPPARAILLPITSPAQEIPAGVIVVALNPYRPLDVSYAGFVNLVSGQIAASIANARAYQEERKRAEALAEIDRAKTAFFSNVSHEFRTPLTLMLGPLQDLLSRSKTHLSPTAAQQLELVNRNGARLLRLVNTLLDFSRIEAGRVRAVYQATDLAGFTTELAGVFRSATERAGLGLVVNCQTTKDIAYVDRDMWEKIVLNLVSNAFKFTFEGEIEVSLSQVDHSAELRVRDTGVGIPPEEMPHLFDRFHRVPNTRSRTHEGTGIGLALVHELVKLHGGSMRVDSTLELGTTFFVTIPLGQAHLAAEQIGGERTLASTATGANPFVQEALRWLPDDERPSEEELPLDRDLLPVPCPSSTIPSDRRRVLIADDNADMRQYLARMLGERFEVVTFADGAAALESIQSRPPDLVLSDIMMPNLDGFGLLQAMRSSPENKTIPVILLSARAGEEARVEGIDAGADDYLIKPFSARELLARVQTHLELARVRNEAKELLELRVQERTKELEHVQAGLHELSAKLLQLQDEERRRIARELHDSAGQTLAVLGMYLDDLKLATNGDTQFGDRVREAQELVQRVTQEIRTTSYLLHPPLLDETGLPPALKSYIDGLMQRTHLKIRLTIDEEFGRLPKELELAMFRIIQECLTNILRHAESDVAEIRISRTSEKVTLEVQDHGKGMSRDTLTDIQEHPSGVGIRGMRDRVKHLNGEMQIHSEVSGTTVSITFPNDASRNLGSRPVAEGGAIRNLAEERVS
jgi:signal transduction histidine kinase/PAS domain-containing protein